MAKEIITRKEALASGLKFYFTGKPCKHGHICERWYDGACVICKKKLNNEYYSRHSDRVIKHVMQRYRENPEAKIEQITRWAKKNRERVRKNHRDWSHKNPIKVAANSRNQRARRAKAPGSHTATQIIELLEWQQWKCAVCGVSIRNKENRHIDHILPIVLGGSNYIWNLRGLCNACNHSKFEKHPIDWDRERGIIY
jgi:5-methylcytosine-specific restriction endonuclease McrA